MKTITKLSPNNLYVRLYTDTHHVGEPVLRVILSVYRRLPREIRRALRQNRPLRRGFILAVADRHLGNRQFYARLYAGTT